MKRRVLQTRAIAKACYKTVFSAGLGDRIIWWVLLLWVGAEALSFLFAANGVAITGRGLILPVFGLYLLVFGLAYSVLIVRWHRFFWAKEEFGTLKSMLPSRRDWRFFFTSVGLLFLSILPILVAVFIAVFIARLGQWTGDADLALTILTLVGIIAFFIAFFYVSFRLCLALPIIALDTKLSIWASWGLTKRHVWKIFATLMLSAGPLFIAVAVLRTVSRVLAENSYLIVALVVDGMVTVGQVLAYATGAGAVTLIYKALTAPPTTGDGSN